MKRFMLPAIALMAGFWSAVAQAVSIPQSPVLTYGYIRDEFGYPLTSYSAAELLLVRDDDPDGRVYARAVVGETPYLGMNYRLSLEIDSAPGGRKYAVTKGTLMRIKCIVEGVDQFAGWTNRCVFATPVNGTAQRLDISLGEDSDNDGMPDAWEEWVIDLAGKSMSIAEFKPNGDNDRDGMSNWDEYLAGTDPFYGTELVDPVSVDIVGFESNAPNGRMAIRFTTVAGHKYKLLTSVSLVDPVWVPTNSSEKPDGSDSSYEEHDGTGEEMTLYVASPQGVSAAFFKIAVE
jgi:hypothetical protein